MRRVIRAELGTDPDEIFESFDETPIASASLAQVHVARERGTGRKLAVKVQHEGLESTSAGDVWLVTSLVELLLCGTCMSSLKLMVEPDVTRW